MRVVFDQQSRLFLWRGQRIEADTPKDAGFELHPTIRRWATSRLTTAARLINLMDNDAIIQYESMRHSMRASEAASVDVRGQYEAPAGQSYRPYQEACISFAANKSAVIIGDDMGLGKTIEAIGICNSDPLARNGLVICPASAKYNWERELNKWSTWGNKIVVVWPGDKIRQINLRLGFTVINADIVRRYPQVLKQLWDYIIVDEFQCMKNAESLRTRAIRQIRARNKLLLSGTPILNQPRELWPALNYLDPTAWPCINEFTRRYCVVIPTPYGNKYKGGSNLIELNERLRSTVMIRRMKSEVLKELPAKIRRVTILPLPGELSGMIAREKSLAADLREIVQQQKDLRSNCASGQRYKSEVADLDKWKSSKCKALATLRRELGEAKAPTVVAYVKECFAAGSKKIILFGHHQSVIELYELGLKKYNCVSLTGSTNAKTRQAAIDRFQADPKCRVFNGSIKAAGTAITLTAANHVLFGELDWVPGDVVQAEDRAHRIGQVDTVLVEHLVFNGSLDCRMATRMVEKLETINEAVGSLNTNVGDEWWLDQI